jgi:hypothetical protein
MIYIDFQAGSHGNYLEFVCNKFLAKVPCGNDPFNSSGASHDKMYLERKKFSAGHWFEFPRSKQLIVNTQVITVSITPDDLLPLTSVSLLRAGDYNIDNDLLEINTFNKLEKISEYSSFLQDLVDSYFQDSRVQGYNAVRDETWPSIATVQDFEDLPEFIKHECESIHGIAEPAFSREHPNCPRHILREFFKIGFMNTSSQGFIKKQHLMHYDSSNQTTTFPFGCFYHADQFYSELEKLAQWLHMPLVQSTELFELHEKFIARQPYRTSKSDCDQLLQQIYNKKVFDLPRLTLLQESYMNACLEQRYHVEAPFDQPVWFANSQHILKHFDLH